MFPVLSQAASLMIKELIDDHCGNHSAGFDSY